VNGEMASVFAANEAMFRENRRWRYVKPITVKNQNSMRERVIMSC